MGSNNFKEYEFWLDTKKMEEFQGFVNIQYIFKLNFLILFNLNFLF